MSIEAEVARLLDEAKQWAIADANRKAEARDDALNAKRITVERLPADLMTRTLPPRRYSQYPYCPLRTAGTLVSEGGAGKSWLKLSMLLHIAAGLPFLGQSIPGSQNAETVGAGPVVYFSAEEDVEEVQRRVQTILRDFDPGDAARAIENFTLINAVGRGLHFIACTHAVTRISDTVDNIIAAVREAGGAIHVAVDTLSRVSGAEENSNAAMATIIASGERIAQALDCSVTFLHHVSKDVARSGVKDAHAGRGASALGDNARSCMRLLTATPDDARKFEGIDPDAVERGDVLVFLQSKHSYGPKAAPVWLQRGANGVLVPFAPVARNAKDTAEEIRAAFVRWWQNGEREPFTRSTVTRTARRTIWPTSPVTEAAAGAFFDEQLEAHLILPAGARKGSPAFTVNPATAEALLAKGTRLEREAEAAWNANPEDPTPDE